jgi:hypothetical protein
MEHGGVEVMEAGRYLTIRPEFDVDRFAIAE